MDNIEGTAHEIILSLERDALAVHYHRPGNDALVGLLVRKSLGNYLETVTIQDEVSHERLMSAVNKAIEEGRPIDQARVLRATFLPDIQPTYACSAVKEIKDSLEGYFFNSNVLVQISEKMKESAASAD